jgi:hypothetical protein
MASVEYGRTIVDLNGQIKADLQVAGNLQPRSLRFNRGRHYTCGSGLGSGRRKQSLLFKEKQEV